MNEVTAGHFDEFVAAVRTLLNLTFYPPVMCFAKQRNDFKIGEPDDIAAIVSFMVRKEAKFMTGMWTSLYADRHSLIKWLFRTICKSFLLDLQQFLFSMLSI